MKKRVFLIVSITLIIILLCAIMISLLIRIIDNNAVYSCNIDSDCVSQCSGGCVNSEWDISNPDASECFRAWDCSCVNNQCYTDGKSPDN